VVPHLRPVRAAAARAGAHAPAVGRPVAAGPGRGRDRVPRVVALGRLGRIRPGGPVRRRDGDRGPLQPVGMVGPGRGAHRHVDGAARGERRPRRGAARLDAAAGAPARGDDAVDGRLRRAGPERRAPAARGQPAGDGGVPPAGVLCRPAPGARASHRRERRDREARAAERAADAVVPVDDGAGRRRTRTRRPAGALDALAGAVARSAGDLAASRPRGVAPAARPGAARRAAAGVGTERLDAARERGARILCAGCGGRTIPAARARCASLDHRFDLRIRVCHGLAGVPARHDVRGIERRLARLSPTRSPRSCSKTCRAWAPAAPP
jgi:hypothetical protein